MIFKRAFFTVLLLLLSSAAAWAQVSTPAPGSYEDTIGKMVARSVESDGSFLVARLIFSLSFVAGIIFTVKGLIQLIKDADTGSKSGIGNGLLKIFSGSLLMSLTLLIAALTESWIEGDRRTTFIVSDVEGLSQEVDFEAFCIGVLRVDARNPDCAGALFANFAADAAGPLTQAIIIFSIIWGIFLIATGVGRLANSQNPSSPHFERTSGIIMRIILGSLAISLPVFLNTVSNSFFNSGAAFQVSILADKPADFVLRQTGVAVSSVNNVTDYYLAMMGFVFYGLIPFGIFAFASGLNSFVKASDGQQGGGHSLGAGIIKMIAGVALVNGKVFTCSMAATLGANVNLVGFCS